MGLAADVPWGSPEAGVGSGAPCSLTALLERLLTQELPAVVAMVDGSLHSPLAPLPEDWRDVRLKTGAGMVTLTRKPGAIVVVVMSGADDALKAAQAKVCAALASMHP